MTEQLPTAGFFKRLAAWVYDFLVAVAIAMLATVFALILQSIIVAVGWLSIPSGQDAASVLTQGYWFTGYLVFVLITFFGYFWRKGGQTIGMRAWRLQVLSNNAERITWKQVYIRAISSLAGIGTLLVLVDFKTKLALQDRLSKTRVVQLSKEQNRELYKKI